jgi:hypothetical protein
MKKKPYKSCTSNEKDYIYKQVRSIVERAESNYIHMLIPKQLVLGIRLADMTPIDMTISDIAEIISKHELCGGRKFIVTNSTNSYGDYTFYFVCGGGGDGDGDRGIDGGDSTANTPDSVEYVELS